MCHSMTAKSVSISKYKRYLSFGHPVVYNLYKFECWQSLALQEHGSHALLVAHCRSLAPADTHFKPDFSAQYIFFSSVFTPAQFFWYQNKKKPTKHLFWQDGDPAGYNFPVSKGRSHCLWAPLSWSPGTKEQLDISLNCWKWNEISRPMIHPIYFPTLRSIRRSCCCLFTLLSLAQRKWSLQGKTYPLNMEIIRPRKSLRWFTLLLHFIFHGIKIPSCNLLCLIQHFCNVLPHWDFNMVNGNKTENITWKLVH